MFSTPNVPGSLFKAMACFALRDVNLTKLESRPLRGTSVGVLVLSRPQPATCDEPRVYKAIANLGEITSFLQSARQLSAHRIVACRVLLLDISGLLCFGN